MKRGGGKALPHAPSSAHKKDTELMKEGPAGPPCARSDRAPGRIFPIHLAPHYHIEHRKGLTSCAGPVDRLMTRAPRSTESIRFKKLRAAVLNASSKAEAWNAVRFNYIDVRTRGGRPSRPFATAALDKKHQQLINWAKEHAPNQLFPEQPIEILDAIAQLFLKNSRLPAHLRAKPEKCWWPRYLPTSCMHILVSQRRRDMHVAAELHVTVSTPLLQPLLPPLPLMVMPALSAHAIAGS